MCYNVTCAFHQPFGDLATDEHVCLYHNKNKIYSCDSCEHCLDSEMALNILRDAVDNRTVYMKTRQMFLDYDNGCLIFYYHNGDKLVREASLILPKHLVSKVLKSMCKVSAGKVKFNSVELCSCIITTERIDSESIRVLISFPNDEDEHSYVLNYNGYYMSSTITDGIESFIRFKINAEMLFNVRLSKFSKVVGKSREDLIAESITSEGLIKLFDEDHIINVDVDKDECLGIKYYYDNDGGKEYYVSVKSKTSNISAEWFEFGYSNTVIKRSVRDGKDYGPEYWEARLKAKAEGVQLTQLKFFEEVDKATKGNDFLKAVTAMGGD